MIKFVFTVLPLLCCFALLSLPGRALASAWAQTNSGLVEVTTKSLVYLPEASCFWCDYESDDVLAQSIEAFPQSDLSFPMHQLASSVSLSSELDSLGAFYLQRTTGVSAGSCARPENNNNIFMSIDCDGSELLRRFLLGE